MNINNILQGYNAQVLKAMARINTIDAGSTRKAAHVKVLAKTLYNKKAVERALPKLSVRERRALDLIIISGGSIISQRLKQLLLQEKVIQERPKSRDRYGYEHRYGVKGDPFRRDSAYFEDIVMRLTCLGLIISQGKTDPYSTVMGFIPGIRLVIPPQVMSHLPQATFEEDTSVPKIEIETESSARTFQRDLYLYWSYIRDHEPQLTQQGYVFKRELKKLNETLLIPGDMGKGMGEKENIRLHFIRLLLQEMGLLKTRRGRSTVAAVRVSDFWGNSPPARVRKSFQTWCDKTFWNELRYLPGITVQSWYATGTEEDVVIAARKKTIEHLKKLPTREWVSLERLVNRLRVADYEFLFSRQVPEKRRHYGYGYYSPEYDTPYSAYRNSLGWHFSPIKDEAQGWEKVEAQFIRNIVTGPLHWLGAVDLGYAEPGERSTARRSDKESKTAISAVAYRITEIGAWLLGLGNAPEIPSDEGRVVVQPNFQIFALDPISDHVLVTLDQFAERVSAERAIEYKLTRGSVYDGQQRGWSVKRVIEYLEEANGAPLPQNVTRTLEEWEALHRRILIHRRTALAQTVNSEVMDRLLGDKTLAVHMSRRLAPTVALLKPSKNVVPQLERKLQQEGLPPARTVNSGSANRTCLSLAQDGQVIFAQQVPSIFLFDTLGHFIQQESDGVWRLTPKSVQQALSRGLAIDGILKELADLHRGALPAWVVRSVKSWGKFYGDARLGTLTLIKFRDAIALRELAADPELAPYLRPFLAERGLAQVDIEDLERVRSLLAERGVEIVGELTSG